MGIKMVHVHGKKQFDLGSVAKMVYKWFKPDHRFGNGCPHIGEHPTATIPRHDHLKHFADRRPVSILHVLPGTAHHAISFSVWVIRPIEFATNYGCCAGGTNMDSVSSLNRRYRSLGFVGRHGDL